MKPWLNVSEAAEYASVSRDTIYTACEQANCEARASADGAPFASGRMDRRLAGTTRHRTSRWPTIGETQSGALS